MEVKKVMPVKPVGAATPVGVKPIVPVAPVQSAIKPVQPVQPVQQVAPVIPQPEVKTETEKPKGGLFSAPSVTDKPKEEKLADVKNAASKVKNKTKAVNKENDEDEEDTESTSNKAPKKKFEGPRRVKVYGQEIFVEENPDVSLEDIRKKLVTDYHYDEFSKERTKMSFDEETGIIVPVISFEKRG